MKIYIKPCVEIVEALEHNEFCLTVSGDFHIGSPGWQEAPGTVDGAFGDDE